MVSAIHKSIRAGDDNAALYWTTRALHSGEDPLFVARRLVRAAAEDIGTIVPSSFYLRVTVRSTIRDRPDIILAYC